MLKTIARIAPRTTKVGPVFNECLGEFHGQMQINHSATIRVNGYESNRGENASQRYR